MWKNYNFKEINKNRKYHNKKVEVDGEVFDSKRESQRWAYLKLLEKRGEVRNLRRQVYYQLTPPRYSFERRFSRNGRELKAKRYMYERPCGYYADFVYEAKRKDSILDEESEWREVVEDFKGRVTTEFILKRKMMLHIHGIVVYTTKSPSDDIPKEVRLMDDCLEQVNGYYIV